MALTRSDIAEIIAMKSGEKLTIREADKGVKALTNYMADSLCQKRRIEIRGFGSFSLSRYAPKKARDPRTGEMLDFEGSDKVVFKAGKKLKDLLDQ